MQRRFSVMEFRHLEIFLAVAETKSFSKAAKHLFLSQSTVSSHIKNLESELQKPLFIRSTKSVELSPDGCTFLRYANSILEMREAALEALNAPSETILRIGASTIPSGYLLPRLLRGFHDSHPHTFFDIQQGDSGEILEKILDGSLELGFIGKKEDTLKCVFLPFCKDDLVLALPANQYYFHLLNQNPPIQEILEEPVILREQGSGTRKAADLYLDSIHLSPENLNVIARTNDLESTKRMIQNGMGISILSKYAVKDLEAQGVILTLPLESGIHRSFYIVYRKDNPLKSAFQDFIQYVKCQDFS